METKGEKCFTARYMVRCGIPRQLTLSMHQKHLEGLLKHSLLRPTCMAMIQAFWVRAQEFAFLSSQLLLMLMGLGPHFQNKRPIHLNSRLFLLEATKIAAWSWNRMKDQKKD